MKIKIIKAPNKKSYGGPMYRHSGSWSNEFVFINEGGRHEDNPFGGVPVGMDSNFTPNLVEEGEIIHNDYVFSNRLKPTKKQLEDSGLNKKYEDWTFAKIVEDLQKETADNPIDFIAQNTLEDMLSIVTNMQEEIRMKKDTVNNKFNDGGPKREVLPTVIPITPTQSSGKPVNPNLTAPVNYIDENIDVNRPSWQEGLRFVSPFVQAGTLLNNLRKPDYSGADKIEQTARNIPGGSFTPLGDYVDFQPLDRNYYLNPLLASSRSTARSIQNQGLNAGQTMAGLLATQYNTNKGVGNALMQMEQENMNRELQEAQFNRGTNQANAQMGLHALAMDQQRAGNILNATAQAVNMRNQLDAMRSQAISESLTGLTEDLGNIGREFTDKNLMKELIKSRALKWSAKKGGMLTRKKRK